MEHEKGRDVVAPGRVFLLPCRPPWNNRQALSIEKLAFRVKVNLLGSGLPEAKGQGGFGAPKEERNAGGVALQKSRSRIGGRSRSV